MLVMNIIFYIMIGFIIIDPCIIVLVSIQNTQFIILYSCFITLYV